MNKHIKYYLPGDLKCCTEQELAELLKINIEDISIKETAVETVLSALRYTAKNENWTVDTVNVLTGKILMLDLLDKSLISNTHTDLNEEVLKIANACLKYIILEDTYRPFKHYSLSDLDWFKCDTIINVLFAKRLMIKLGLDMELTTTEKEYWEHYCEKMNR